MVEEYKAGKFSDLSDTNIGRKLWEFLNREDNIIRMETASDLKKPAVEAIVIPLLREFDRKYFEDLRTRQMIGHMVKQILLKRGFALCAQNVILRTRVIFAKGSRYERVLTPEKADNFMGYKDSCDG